VKKNRIKWLLIAAIIVSLAFIAGCAQPPAKEIEDAAKAVADAKLKEADQYSQDIFAKAEGALKKAKDLVVAKNYKEAKTAAEGAINLAKQAAQAVEANKAKMKEEAEKMVLDIQSSINELKSSVSQAIRKKAQINQQEIQGAIGKLEVELVAAKENLQAGKIRPALDQLTSLQTEIESHKETVKAVLGAKSDKK
jgi:hypothetical protein